MIFHVYISDRQDDTTGSRETFQDSKDAADFLNASPGPFAVIRQYEDNGAFNKELRMYRDFFEKWTMIRS